MLPLESLCSYLFLITTLLLGENQSGTFSCCIVATFNSIFCFSRGNPLQFQVSNVGISFFNTKSYNCLKFFSVVNLVLLRYVCICSGRFYPILSVIISGWEILFFTIALQILPCVLDADIFTGPIFLMAILPLSLIWWASC